MPVQHEYQRCRDHLYDFLRDVADTAGIETSHRTYTMTQGVFQAFRRRLSLAESIRFDRTLPVGRRALYVEAWDPDEPLAPPGDRADWVREAKALRHNYNFATADCVCEVAGCLRRHLVDADAFDRVLAGLAPWATTFWTPAERANRAVQPDAEGRAPRGPGRGRRGPGRGRRGPDLKALTARRTMQAVCQLARKAAR